MNYAGTLLVCRTLCGHEELATPRMDLPDASRHMLQRLDKAVGIRQWSVDAGATLSDGVVLLRLGLARAAAVALSDGRSSAFVLHVDHERFLRELMCLEHLPLYRLLTNQARDHFGLIHGFRMVLAIERCGSIDDLRALALKYVDDVWRVEGVSGMQVLYDSVHGLGHA